MGCPFHNSGNQDDEDSQDSPPASKGVPRRQFTKAALAIGGSAALSACLEREFGSSGSATPTSSPEFPEGPDDPDKTYPSRQFRWNDVLAKDPHGGTVAARHQLILLLDYAGNWPPDEEDRTVVETALTTAEQAFQRGTGGDVSAIQTKGLLYLLGYSRSYFDRYDESLPESVDLPRARELLQKLDEDPSNADEYDAALILTSDYASLLLSVEQALFGESGSLNGVDIETDLSSVFEVGDRRTGFMGKGLAQEADHDQIPEKAPLSMGFSSAFDDTLPNEDKVTIEDGPFVDATTLQVSKLVLDLDSWYDRDHDDRVELMFSPEHTAEQVGETGSGLGDHSAITTEIVDDVDAHAKNEGRLGHGQKTARARDESFELIILRRSEGINTDDSRTAFNFTSIQQGMSDFIETREAMNSTDFDEVDQSEHGILDFLEVTNRASLLVPPRSMRAFPRPRPQ